MKHVDYVCFQNRSGYAQAAQDYLFALKGSPDLNIHLSLMHSKADEISVSKERYLDLMAMLRTPLGDNPIQVLHCIPEMQRRVKRTGKTVGFATFETYQPPEHWIDILNTNDAVICPSTFNMKVFEHAGVKKPMFHIPHVIDTSLYHQGVEPSQKAEPFTFLFFSTWKRRKGWRELFEAYFREFTSADNVRLYIKTDRLMNSNRDIDAIRKNLGLSEKETAPIIYETRVLTEKELPHFLKSADCRASPTYGEGFGLPGLQCMALGVPIIITDFSGCTDYATEETATLLKPSGFILYNEMDGVPQFRNKKWSHISVESLRSSMRSVYSDPTAARNKAKFAADWVPQRFGYQVAVDRFNQLMENL